MVAVEMIDIKQGYLAPGRARFTCVKSENGKDILRFVKKCIKRDSKICADGGTGISVIGQIQKDYDNNEILDENGNTISKHGYSLEQSNFDKDSNKLEFIHKFISNFDSLILGTYHGVDLEYVDELLNEYTWRYNYRFEDNNMRKVYLLLSSLIECDKCTQEDLKVRKSKDNIIPVN